MTSNRSKFLANKSRNRTWIIDQLMDVMKGGDIFDTIDYRQQPEHYIRQYMHQPLKKRMLDICTQLYPNLSTGTLELKAEEALLWEGDVQTTINNIRFFGVQHRPDFAVHIEGIRIAIEIKRGEDGSAIREGLGQSVVYAVSNDYDFVVYLFIDVSGDKKILREVSGENERFLIESLWENYNIRFDIV